MDWLPNRALVSSNALTIERYLNTSVDMGSDDAATTCPAKGPTTRWCAHRDWRSSTATSPIDIREKCAILLLQTFGRRRRGTPRLERTGPAGHARPVDSQDAVAERHARLGTHATHPGSVARRVARRPGLDLPCPRQARATWPHRHRVAYHREQPPRQVLPHLRRRSSRARPGARELAALRRRRATRHRRDRLSDERSRILERAGRANRRDASTP